MSNIFTPADILLPKRIGDSEYAKKWAVIACDQFTAESDYWQNVENEVGASQSALRIILPEVYLSEKEKRFEAIAQKMAEYKTNVFAEYKNSMIFVRRHTNGKIRHGIVGKIDLEQYDYSVGSNTPVRATEGTVLERIPPRVAVRRNAVIESPHIMLLIDDADRSIIEPLDHAVSQMEKLYDFDLMLGGGKVEGYLLTETIIEDVLKKISELFNKNDNSIKFAVGDGNHSLASAKARYEELKEKIGEEKAKKHPLRYALCEVVNLHDDALEFEPIYRIVKTKNKYELLNKIRTAATEYGDGTQCVDCLFDGKTERIMLGGGTHMLTVGTLQNLLDSQENIEIDYIHGIDSITKLSEEADCVGFVFDGMKKEELFAAVERDGALPRKTFSMGEARDKRYYIECRDITE